LTWAGPIPDLGNEDEEKLIDAFASEVVNFGMASAAILFLEGMKPVSKFTAEVPLLIASPFLETLGINSYDYVALLGKRGSVEKIIIRIEELNEEKKKEEEAEKALEPVKETGFIDRIKRALFG
jgi:hypothetical protein